MYREPGPPSAAKDYGRYALVDCDPCSSQLLAHVHAAFPGFPVSGTRLENGGGDHVLLIVDEQFAFRFPRADMHGLGFELRTLSQFQIHRSVRTPTYEYVDPLGRFAGYRLIAGSPLTGERFAQTSAKVQRALIAEVAAFLSTLHRLDQRSIAPVSKWPRAWGAVEYADRLAVERLPLIRTRLPQLASPVAGFLQQYRIDRPPGLVVIHGDLVTDHILMEDDVERLAGIIDFGDVALGDPALDIAGCWTYGSDAVVHLIASYGLGDPGLLDRSRNHFIRYRIDRLFDALVEGKPADAVKPEVAEITMLLARYAGRS